MGHGDCIFPEGSGAFFCRQVQHCIDVSRKQCSSYASCVANGPAASDSFLHTSSTHVPTVPLPQMLVWTLDAHAHLAKSLNSQPLNSDDSHKRARRWIVLSKAQSTSESEKALIWGAFTYKYRWCSDFDQPYSSYVYASFSPGIYLYICLSI